MKKKKRRIKGLSAVLSPVRWEAGADVLPPWWFLMKCIYLNPESTGHSLKKQTANADNVVFLEDL